MTQRSLERVAVVTDAWRPQVNGVVRTLACVSHELEQMGKTVEIISPDRFPGVACPTYPEIRLALFPRRRLIRLVAAFRPDTMHIMTEGPLGRAARSWAMQCGLRFTTSLHTRFPDYVAARTGLPPGLGWAVLRRFHAASAATLAATESLRQELSGRGFQRTRLWSRGVDTDAFRPVNRSVIRPVTRPDGQARRPVFLNVGRVAVEKNIQAFLDLDLPGSKMVVGDGPLLPKLRRRYPQVTFTGALHGPALADACASADVFVFPSRTDTFGLVLLESMACGTPVAAYPVPGPADVVGPSVGVLHQDLRVAAMAALTLDRADCRAHAERSSWRACAETFLSHLVPLQPA